VLVYVGVIYVIVWIAYNYLRQGEDYGITSLCLSDCVQDYFESYQPISLKLDVMIGPTNRKN